MSKYNADAFVCVETRINSNRARKIIDKISLCNFVETPPPPNRFIWWNLTDSER